MQRFIGLIVALMVLAPFGVQAQISNDGLAPTSVRGVYQTTYYAHFHDWQVFPALLPMINADPTRQYEERFDLRPEGQIVGRLQGDVRAGAYLIDLPTAPVNAAFFDTDGDPETPSPVKVFVVGTGSGMIGQQHVSRYDFMYTRSYGYNPNTQLWEGSLLVWSAEDDARFPVLSGADKLFYTADDVMARVPSGWSVVEVKGSAGQQSVRVYQTSQPYINLLEPNHLESVDLSDLSYESAFEQLLTELERTYVFTDYRGVDWAALRERYTPKAAQVRTPREFHQLLETTLFSFRDGHLSITGRGMPDWYWGMVGMRVYPVEGELMVVETFSQSPAGQSNAIAPGTVITQVNGQDAMSYFNHVPRTVFSGGHEAEDNWMRGDLAFRGVPGTAFALEYRQPDGTQGSITLQTVPMNTVSRDAPLATNLPLYYGLQASGVGLIGIRNFTSAQVDDLWDDAMQLMIAAQVPGIVIDLRQNTGGFSSVTNYIIGDFLDEDVYSGREVSAIDKDGDGILDINEEYYYGRGKIFDPARVMVMIGPECFSACEFAALAFQDIGATIIGHLPSGGAGGGVGASYFLPGNTRVYGMAVVRSEDPQGNIVIEGLGVPLDVQVPFTPEGLASGADLVLQTAERLLLALP